MSNTNLLCVSVYRKWTLFLFLVVAGFSQLYAQGVTSANIVGKIVDAKGAPIPGAVIIAKHEPSGSVYSVETREDGHFNLPDVRIGGPYTIKAELVGLKMKDENAGKEIFLSLGETYRFNTSLIEEATILSEVVVSATTKGSLINGQKNGTGTNIDKQTLATMPTLNRSFNDFLRLTPQGRSSSVASTAGQGLSFAGQDSRFNNLTIDGSIFNNSFGLASGPGGQTNAQPISIDALEEIQVNIAPYDVRQAGFTGAGINAVTKSGTNEFHGSAFVNNRGDAFVGTKVDTFALPYAKYNVTQAGASFGGPIIKDKLFFFVNAEIERRSDPAQYTAYRGAAGANVVSRVSADTLDALSKFLQTKYNYSTGAYDNYSLATYSDKALAKLDYNISKIHHASVSFKYLKSSRDVFESGSGSVSGSRNGVTTALNFQNSNYIINNDLYSGIFELNSLFSTKLSNKFQAGYTVNRDYRSTNSSAFPLVDIQGPDATTMISFGYEPFSIDNFLYTNTFQIKDDVTMYLKNHTITAGVNFESFKFDNSFKPRFYGHYTFSSLSDFYASANGTSVPALKQYFQTVGLVNGDVPEAISTATQPGVYIQDEVSALDDKLKMTFGVRADFPTFGDNNAINNTEAASYTFLDENKQSVKYNTAQLPTSSTLISPRFGFNYDVKGDRTIQLRGGTGLFTGRPAFVWISNAVSNNGVTQAQTLISGAKYAFNPDYKTYLPATVSGPPTYNLATIDPNFKFPQTWRSNLGIDIKLPGGIIATVEGLYSKVVNNILYINSNLVAPVGAYAGADGDNRPYYNGVNTYTDSKGAQVLYTNGAKLDSANRINYKVTDNTVLKNTDQGYSWSITAKLEKPFRNTNWSAMVAYNLGQSIDLITGGSIANSSWTGTRSVKGNNYLPLANSDFDLRNRFVMSFSYRIPEGQFGSTVFTLFGNIANQGNGTFTVSGDANGDQISGNDLMFVPTATQLSVMKFDTLKVGARTFAPDVQRNAFESFVSGNDYLNSRRGQHAERNGWVLPFLATFDLSVIQNLNLPFSEKTKHSIQLRLDIANVGNLINPSWGVADRFKYSSPLAFQRRDLASNQAVYKFNSQLDPNNALATTPLVKNVSLFDAWQMQFSLRYSF